MIHIVSDSKAALRAIGSSVATSKTVLECSKLLTLASRNNSALLSWTKAQYNNSGNEEADQLAKRAAREYPVGPEPIVPLSLTEINSIVYSCTYQKHVNLWDSITTCKHAKTIMPQLSPRMVIFCNRLPRPKLRLMVGFLTGHYTLQGHI